MHNEEQTDDPDVDALVEELKRRVEERRRQGLYPEALEERLEAHARRILDQSRSVPHRFDRLEARLGALRKRADFPLIEPATSSRLPGGGLIHRGFARLLSRYLGAVQEQMKDVAEEIVEVLEEMAELVRDPSAHEHRDVVGSLDAVLETLALREREQQRLEFTIGFLDDQTAAE